MCFEWCIRRWRQRSSAKKKKNSTNQESSPPSVKPAKSQKKPQNDIRSADDGAAKKSQMLNVYKSLVMAKKQGKECTYEEKKRYLEKAHRAMGMTPNTTIVERYEKRAQQLDRTQNMSEAENTTSRRAIVFGDIPFTLPMSIEKPKEKTKETTKESTTKDSGSKEPDTERPRLLHADLVDNEELNEDDELHDYEIDDKNYMYHDQEIVFTCRDMMRDVGIVDFLVGIGSGEEDTKHSWNPLAPMEDLTGRKEFDCMTLRRHTFISNSSAMPNEEEKKNFTENDPGTPGHSFDDVVIELLGDKKIAPMSPICTKSMSCAQTQNSEKSFAQKSNRSSRSKKEMMKAPRKSKTAPSNSKRGRSVPRGKISQTLSLQSSNRKTVSATKSSATPRSSYL
ncbi:hypothetical protein QR680_008169 [Steinernema hermaphroditum]|uniref:Uncharacterized protein n=1 Tax=Steinernema hermaphroditum TaxID=289476 RepID=A0AA39M7L5_9BILA|nr:hypothetical protein QR680_008169 [Steinernema hermaphroditum]